MIILKELLPPLNNMEYIIAENRLIRLIDNYIDDTLGELRKVDYVDVNAREGDFEILDENGGLVARYVDYHFGVKQQLFLDIMNYFNLSNSETEGLFKIWFEKKYPDNLLLGAYCSIYY